MFCTNCGSQIPDGVKFCTNCGTAVAEASPLSTHEQVSIHDSPDVGAYSMQEIAERHQGNAKQDLKKPIDTIPVSKITPVNEKLKLVFGYWNAKTIVCIFICSLVYGFFSYSQMQIPEIIYQAYSFPFIMRMCSLLPILIPFIITGLFGTVPAVITILIGEFLVNCLDLFWQYESLHLGIYNWTFLIYGLFISTLPLCGANIGKGVFEKKQVGIYILILCCGLILWNSIAPKWFLTNETLIGVLIHLYNIDPVADFKMKHVLIVFVSALGVIILYLFAKRYKKIQNEMER
jgi:hypothetical protein